MSYFAVNPAMIFSDAFALQPTRMNMFLTNGTMLVAIIAGIASTGCIFTVALMAKDMSGGGGRDQSRDATPDGLQRLLRH